MTSLNINHYDKPFCTYINDNFKHSYATYPPTHAYIWHIKLGDPKLSHSIPIFITKITIFSTISSKPYYMANLISVDGRL